MFCALAGCGFANLHLSCIAIIINLPLSAPLRLIRLTAPGRGAVATLRVEGGAAAEVVSRHFAARGGRPLTELPADRIVIGHVGGPSGEEVVVRKISAEAVELHCHGGLAAVALLERLFTEAGGTVISWQDWVAGQESDPIAGAARIALAEARTARTAAILLDQHRGALRQAIDEIVAARSAGDAAKVKQLSEVLLGRAPLGRHLVQPWKVVLAGRPNVGKSSLMNALAGYGRAIVHAQPGTTRDAVTITTAMEGWPVELSDTAGLRTSDDAVERAGIELARQRLAEADLAVLLFDITAPWTGEDAEFAAAYPRAFVVHNKADLLLTPVLDDRPTGLAISALQATGIEELCRAIAARLVPEPPPPGVAVPFTAEQVAEIEGCDGTESSGETETR